MWKITGYQGYEKSAHLYDLFDTKDNIDFFYHYAKDERSILDIGAGTGRIAIPLAEKGVEVTCIEPASAMRDQFINKLRKTPILFEKIVLIAADASNFRLKRKFPAAFSSGSFDHLLDDNERITALTNIKNHLKDGGKLIFDVFIGLMRDSPLSPAGSVKKEEYRYERFVSSKVLPDNKIKVHLVFKTFKDDELIEEIKEESFAGRINRQKIHEALEQTGFEISDEYSDYNFTPFKDKDSLLIVEAVKRSEEVNLL